MVCHAVLGAMSICPLIEALYELLDASIGYRPFRKRGVIELAKLPFEVISSHFLRLACLFIAPQKLDSVVDPRLPHMDGELAVGARRRLLPDQTAACCLIQAT
jgi:hypothetical protein